jgi:hypothetical protein
MPATDGALLLRPKSPHQTVRLSDSRPLTCDLELVVDAAKISASGH